MNRYSNLTHETTESDLMVPVAQARAALLDLASTYTEGQAKWADSEHILAATQELWAAEACARAAHTIVQCLIGIQDESDEFRAYSLLKCFQGILEVGADDSWSGRKNDTRRHAHDEVRKMLSSLRWTLVPAIARTTAPTREV